MAAEQDEGDSDAHHKAANLGCGRDGGNYNCCLGLWPYLCSKYEAGSVTLCTQVQVREVYKSLQTRCCSTDSPNRPRYATRHGDYLSKILHEERYTLRHAWPITTLRWVSRQTQTLHLWFRIHSCCQKQDRQDVSSNTGLHSQHGLFIHVGQSERG